MTRKHFIALAAAVKGISNPEERKRAARAIADVCAAQTAISTGGGFSAHAGSKGRATPCDSLSLRAT